MNEIVSRIRSRLLSPEGRLLILGLLAVLAVYGFVKIAGEVGEGETRSFDEAVLRLFRSAGNPEVAAGPWWLKPAMADLTSLGSTTVLGLVVGVVAVYLLLIGNRTLALFTVLSAAGGTALNNVLKLGFNRPRPEVVGHLAEVYTLSFPSGHAMISAVVYLTLGALLARTSKSWSVRLYCVGVAMLLTVLVGVSRLYLGVHYPTDVLAGWAAGAAWAIASLVVAGWISVRKAERAA